MLPTLGLPLSMFVTRMRRKFDWTSYVYYEKKVSIYKYLKHPIEKLIFVRQNDVAKNINIDSIVYLRRKMCKFTRIRQTMAPLILWRRKTYLSGSQKYSISMPRWSTAKPATMWEQRKPWHRRYYLSNKNVRGLSDPLDINHEIKGSRWKTSDIVDR